MNNTMMKDLYLPKESKKQIYPNKYTDFNPLFSVDNFSERSEYEAE